jgi:uncharacterized Fe-S cluster protein YjdI
MAGKLQQYSTPEITVTFDPAVCTHAARCVKGLPAVFDVSRRAWIDPSAASADAVEAQVKQCPSGALQFHRAAAQEHDASA